MKKQNKCIICHGGSGGPGPLTGCSGSGSGKDGTAEANGTAQCRAGREHTAAKDSVVVVMTTYSEPEAGFDPAYGWGPANMSMSR